MHCVVYLNNCARAHSLLRAQLQYTILPALPPSEWIRKSENALSFIFARVVINAKHKLPEKAAPTKKAPREEKAALLLCVKPFLALNEPIARAWTNINFPGP